MKIRHLFWLFLFIFPAIANGGKTTEDKATDVVVINEVSSVITNEVSSVITNDAAINPVPVTSVSYPREPWAVSQGIFIPEGRQITSVGDILGTVPAGKILVIENYSFKGVFNKSRMREFWIRTKTNGISTTRQILVKDSISGSGGGGTIYFGDRQVRYYCDEGTDIRFSPVRDGDLSENINVQVVMSGYLVPLNSPSLAP